MAQLGYNSGPRHAQVFGLAKSYTKNLSKDIKVKHDNDAMSVCALLWALVKAHLPTEVVRDIRAGQDAIPGLPASMATRNVEPGTYAPKCNLAFSKTPPSFSGNDFVFEWQGKEYHFKEAERAPPEGYLAVDYTA